MIFGYSEEELTGLGACHTVHEIAQQPELWKKTYRLIKGKEQEIKSFLKEHMKPETRVVLAGAGSSDYVGDVIEGYLDRLLPSRVRAVATTDIVMNADEVLEKDTPTVLVSFARSGSSPESIGAYHIFQNNVKDITQLVITCNAEGELAKMAEKSRSNFVIVLPEETNDKGFAMTSSYSCMMLAALLFFDIEQIDALESIVEKIALAGADIIENGWGKVKGLCDLKPERLVYLGARCFEGLVQEMALKNLELTNGKVVSIHESVLGFRHGPKTFVNDKTFLVIFTTSSAYTNLYVRDMAKELYSDEGDHRVIVIGYRGCAEFQDICDVCIDISGEQVPEIFTVFPCLLYAQLFGLFNSLTVGNRPDTPNPAGTVNRVVKGVTLYDYSGEG